MESEIAVKPEPLWFVEDEEVNNVDAKNETILSANVCDKANRELKLEIDIEEESHQEDISVYSLKEMDIDAKAKPETVWVLGYEEMNCTHVKDEAQLSSHEWDEINEGVKTEIDVEENCILEQSSEFIQNCKISEDSNVLEHERIIVPSTDNVHWLEGDTLECEQQVAASGETQLVRRISNKKFCETADNSFSICAHTSETQFECAICGECFKNYSHFIRHMNDTHALDKSFNCNMCSKCFTNPSILKQHLSLHTGDKPLKCNKWSKSSTSRERVLALVEEGGFSARQAAACYGVSSRCAQRWIKQYRETGEIGRRKGTGLRRVSTREEDSNLVAISRRNPFLNAVQLKQVANFPGSSDTIRRRLKDSKLGSHGAVVNGILSKDHRLYRRAFAEMNADHDWRNVIFSDETTFSSGNEGPIIVYKPCWTRHDPLYISVSCWGWISSEGAGVLHRIEGRLTGDQYLHIMQNFMVPSVRMRYPTGNIQFQQDQSPIHTSCIVQGWFSEQADIELLDWPARSPDLNPIENVWAEMKRDMTDNWPDPPPRSQDALWDVMLDSWERLATNEGYFLNLAESIPQQLTRVIEANGFWT